MLENTVYNYGLSENCYTNAISSEVINPGDVVQVFTLENYKRYPPVKDLKLPLRATVVSVVPGAFIVVNINGDLYRLNHGQFGFYLCDCFG